MTLLSLIVLLAVVGLVLWLVTTYVPMDASIRRIIIGVVVIVVVFYLLRVFGFLGQLERIRV